MEENAEREHLPVSPARRRWLRAQTYLRAGPWRSLALAAGLSLVLGLVWLVWPAAGWRLARGAVEAGRPSRPIAALASPATPTPTATSTPTLAPTSTSTPSPAPSATPTLPPTSTPTETPTCTVMPVESSPPSPEPTDPLDCAALKRERSQKAMTVLPGAAAPAEPTATRVAPPRIRVPILMYHHVGTAPAGVGGLERDLTVSPARFREQLAWLRRAGYESISLLDLVQHLNAGAPLPEKPIIITFDDGYTDAYTEAAPLLVEYGYRATFFIITDFIDRKLPPYMSWEQIVGLEAQGMEIGSHSRDHPDLRRRSIEYLVWQILGSKQTLEAHLKAPVRVFSYPSGRYDEQVIKVLVSAGFLAAVTTETGVNHSGDDLMRLKRIRVRGGDALNVFINRLEAGGP